MATHGEVAERFAARGRPLRGHNVYATQDYIYSYGSHFPMAYADDERKLFIINGDTFSSSTSSHQRHVRSAIQNRLTWNNFIIPFSVLRSANVELETLEVIEQGQEIDEAGCRTCDLRWDFRQSWIARNEYNEHYEKFGPNKPNYLVYGRCEEHENSLGNTHLDFYSYKRKHYHRNPEYRPNPHDMYTRHLLAPSLVKGWRRIETKIEGSPCDTCGDSFEEHNENSGRWHHNYYPQVKRTSKAFYFLSGFDDTARAWGGGYFFSELPRKASSIAEAYQLLRPKPVLEADQAGVEVKRQGDIFAIPVEVETRKLTKKGTRLRGIQLLKTNHFATEVIVTKTALYARGFLHHRPSFREADHRRIKLGKAWHQIFRNTAKGSWSASRGTGRVD